MVVTVRLYCHCLVILSDNTGYQYQYKYQYQVPSVPNGGNVTEAMASQPSYRGFNNKCHFIFIISWFRLTNAFKIP